MNDQQPNFMLKMLLEFSKQPFEFELRKTMNEKKGSSLYLNRFANKKNRHTHFVSQIPFNDGN